MRAGGGYVALFGNEDRRIRLVRASDGEPVATVDPPEERWAAAAVVGLPIGAIGGYVGISRSANFGVRHQEPLSDTTWLDLRTGETATPEDVFAPFAGDEEPVEPGWVFHGIVTNEQGEPEPVFSRTQPQSSFELLEPGEGFRTYQLPTPPTDGQPASGVASAGATTDRFAAWHEGVRNPADMATIVLDRTTGTTTTIEGLRGVALLDDLLLAETTDESKAALIAVDPATGEERWRAEPHARNPDEDVLLVDEELVIDMGLARVTAMSTQNGTQRWTHASDTQLKGDALLGPRHVTVATTNGQLVALDRRDGAVAWRANIETPIASLTGAGDHVLVGTHDGLIVQLDGRGREVQRIAAGTGAVHEVAALGETVVAIIDGRVIGLRDDGTGIIREDEVEVP
jgi:outer membrane protein assembly factor BamB